MPLASSVPNANADDGGAIGLGVEHAGRVRSIGADAVIGEVEPAFVVEDQIVRRDELATVALRVDGLDRAGVEVDRLDRSARVVADAPRDVADAFDLREA